MLRPWIATGVLCSAAAAQSFFVPNNSTSGTCEIVPFGQLSLSPSANHRYQTRLSAAQLGGAPNTITGLGFVSCGVGAVHLDAIRVVMDHVPPAQPTSTTFASNLTSAAVTVLDAVDYTWNGSTLWREIGMQHPFAFNGVDDVIVDITTSFAWHVASPHGFRGGGLPRLFWSGAGTPPPAGTLDNNGLRIEVSTGRARVASLGRGCGGWSGPLVITHNLMPTPGSPVTFQLQEAVPGTFAVFIAGTTNAVPVQLSVSPACYLFTDPMFTAVVPVNGSLPPTSAGSAAYPVSIPPGLIGFRFCAQFAMWPASPAIVVATSNYLHLVTGL